ncbi:MAG: TMEM165/GDT1 family protein [Deltaproteobacteria bacterium]|nr:MAG: TMEM165/GDT1 family protein [Deltaproteobacteria bacterium]
MAWKLFASTFAAIFVAEIGDKTQLAAFALAGGTSSRWTVFAAASLALVATTAIAVIAGAAVGRYVPAIWLRRGAGVLFVAMGLVFLWTAPPAEHPDERAQAADRQAAARGE